MGHDTTRTVRASVVIAAYNEQAVIGRNLDRLLTRAGPGELDVTVVANGCTDRTADVARSRGVRTVELPEPGKAAALNAGDAAAVGFPRVYLDADVGADADTVRRLVEALAPAAGGTAPLVAVPRRRLLMSGRPWPVRAYYEIQTRLPAAREGLFGRGMIAVSEVGRGRFGDFPPVVADDLFLDSLFGPDERVVAASAITSVETPRTTADLVRRLTRVRRGNAELRARGSGDADTPAPAVRPARRTSWLRDVVIPDPRLAPAGLVFAVLTVVAEVRARRTPARWEVDTSSRTIDPGATA